MKCDCGKELKATGIIVDKDYINQLDLISAKRKTANMCFNSELLNDISLSDESVYDFVKASVDALAEATFLDVFTNRELRRKYNIEKGKCFKIDELTNELYTE